MGKRRLIIALAVFSTLVLFLFFVGRRMATTLGQFLGDLSTVSQKASVYMREPPLKIDPFGTHFVGGLFLGTTTSDRFFSFDLQNKAVVFQHPVSETGQRFAVSRSVVYLGNDKGALDAVSLTDGGRLWTLSAQVVPYSPVLVDERAVVFWELDDSLAAADPRTGSLRWRVKTPGMYAGILHADVIEVGDGGVYFFGRDDRLHAIDLAEGRELWSEPFLVFDPPVASTGSLYVQGFEEILCLDSRDGTLRWKFRPPVGRFADRFLLSRDALYALGESGAAYALELKSGRVLWSAPLSNKTWYGGASWILKDQAIYLATPEEALYALDIADGRVLWRIVPETSGERYTSPALLASGNELYAAFNQSVAAVEKDSGRVLWSWRSPERVVSDRLHLTGELLYLEAEDPETGVFRVYGLDKKTGSVRSTADFRYDNSPGFLVH